MSVSRSCYSWIDLRDNTKRRTWRAELDRKSILVGNEIFIRFFLVSRTNLGFLIYKYVFVWVYVIRSEIRRGSFTNSGGMCVES